MLTLTEFLTARYDEEEAALTAYQEHRAGLTPCINYEERRQVTELWGVVPWKP